MFERTVYQHDQFVHGRGEAGTPGVIKNIRTMTHVKEVAVMETGVC